MTSTILHFDSYSATYNTSQQYSTYTISNSSSSSAANSFNCTWQLPFQLKNVKQIKLKSVEIPIAINSVRANSNTNTFSYSSDNITFKTISLSDANYTDITLLIADLNTKITATYPSDNLTFSLVSSKVRLTSTSITNIYIANTLLSEMLGFWTGTNTIATNYTQATLPYILSLDLYLMLYFPNISTQQKNVSGNNGHFKVPLNSVNGSIYYMSEATSYIQIIDCDINVLEKLTVCVLDRWGNSLNSNGYDYSMSLEIIS